MTSDETGRIPGSEYPRAPDWWVASDGLFYPPELHPPVSEYPRAPDWWMASDGLFYPPELHPPVPAKSPVGYWMAAMFKDFLNFEGRARRAEYWWTYLINSVIFFVSSVISPEVGSLFVFIILIPSFALTVRRMHDTNSSGFLLIIPVVGFVYLCRDGDKGQNRFGPSPK